MGGALQVFAGIEKTALIGRSVFLLWGVIQT